MQQCFTLGSLISKIEEIAQERLPFFLLGVCLLRSPFFIGIELPGGLRCRLGTSSFDKFVELAPIEPYPSAFWAVVDLYAAALSNHKNFSVHGTLHSFLLHPK